jgi:hypothetical protein
MFPAREPSCPGHAFEDDDEEYEIEKILDHLDERGKQKYLVHWLGYSTSDDQSIDGEDLHAPELLAPYLTSVDAHAEPRPALGSIV